MTSLVLLFFFLRSVCFIMELVKVFFSSSISHYNVTRFHRLQISRAKNKKLQSIYIFFSWTRKKYDYIFSLFHPRLKENYMSGWLLPIKRYFLPPELDYGSIINPNLRCNILVNPSCRIIHSICSQWQACSIYIYI